MPEADIDRLAAYLRQYRGKYTPEVLRQHLLAQGFDPEAVEVAAGIDQFEREQAGLAPEESSRTAAPEAGGRKMPWGRLTLAGLGGVILISAVFLMIEAMARPAFPSFSTLIQHLGTTLSVKPLPGFLVLPLCGLLLELGLVLFGSILGDRAMARVGLFLFLGTLALFAVVLLAAGGCFGLLNGMMTEGRKAREDAFGWTWSIAFLGLFFFALIGLILLVWSLLSVVRERWR